MASACIGLLVAIGIMAWLINILAPWGMGDYMGTGSPGFAVRAEKEVSFTTEESVTLVANVYHPRRAGQVPAILVRVPYTGTFMYSYTVDLISRMWAERGYIVLVQGNRGRGDSGGTYDPLRHEREDGLETLNWLAKQPWFDGRLEMWGSSYYVSEGIVRLKPGMVGIDEPAMLTIELWPTSLVFKKGHRVRLEVSSSIYPRFDRNPNTGREIGSETRPVSATQTVYHGVSLPVRFSDTDTEVKCPRTL